MEVNYSKERLFEDIKGLYGELLRRKEIEIVKEHNVCEY